MIDLFGNRIPSDLSIQEQYILDKDKFSLPYRVGRLRYLYKINPDGLMFAGNMELVFSYREAQEAFIAGNFLSTIVLAQAFIEKILQDHFEVMCLGKIARKGLVAMIEHAKAKNLVHEFILDKIDWIRLIRNPITHLKDLEYAYSLDKRAFANKKNPLLQLEDDAKMAISIMTFIAMNGIKR